MARVAAALFAAGGGLTLLYMAIPHEAGDDARASVAVALAAFVVAAVILARSNRLPLWSFQLFALLGTLLATAWIHFSHVVPSAAAVIYLWVVLYAFYFFTLREAGAQLAAVSGAYATLLALRPPEFPAVGHAVLLIGSLAVVGLLTAYLKSRVESLVTELAAAARTDYLTGLMNRRGFEEQFTRDLARARRTERPLSLLLGDLNTLKRINDELGHEAGDRALKEVTALLEQGGRASDTAARVGGDEFAVILPDAGEKAARVVADRFRRSVRRAFAGRPVPLTISFGVATFPRHGETLDALLRAADHRLYADKELRGELLPATPTEVRRSADPR